MALTLGQLLEAPTVDQWRSMVLASLQGLGIVVEGGSAAGGIAIGSGTISTSGTPAASYPKVIVNITATGELGTALFQYSLDGGATFVSGLTVPATTGIYVLGATGITVTFGSGAGGAGTSFVLGDSYTFALAIPTLPVTAWSAAGSYRQLVETEAQALAAQSTQQSGIAAGGYTTSATGAWADLIGNGFYGLARLGVGALAGVTKGLITLSDAAGAGPFTITAGTMWFAAGDLLFSNTSGGTLTKNGTLQISVAAQSPGSSYNVGNNAITTCVAGVLPGVIGTGIAGAFNPDPGSGSWITSQGTDPETDQAYMLRCQQRWPSLGTGSPAPAYQLWATEAEEAAGHSTTITKTLVQQDLAIAGQIDIFLAGSAGGVSGGAVTDTINFVTPLVAMPATISVASATNVPVAVSGTVVYYSARANLTRVQKAVNAALIAYFTPIQIGKDLAGNAVKVSYAEVEAAIGSILGGPGVTVQTITSLTTNGGTSDIGLTLGEVATLTNSLSFSGI